MSAPRALGSVLAEVKEANPVPMPVDGSRARVALTSAADGERVGIGHGLPVQVQHRAAGDGQGVGECEGRIGSPTPP